MLFLRIAILALTVGLGVAPNQQISVEIEPQPNRPPQSTPEPRRKLAVNPDSLFPLIVSEDPSQRSKALEVLGMSWMGEMQPTDARLLAVNLDSDQDLERVLIMKSNLNAAVVVLKNEKGTWWELGSFFCCGPSGRVQEPFVELRQTVWHGTNDLIVHAVGAHGTGVGEGRLMIYRVWKGNLYKVLDISEWEYNMRDSETSRIFFPDMESHASPQVITVIKDSQKRRKATCIPYRWEVKKFAFVQIPPSPKFCLGPAGTPP